MVYSQKKSFQFQKEPENYIIGTLRLLLGWIWLWTFLDKLIGFGFSTASENSWLAGNSPTLGFLKFGTNPDSPFSFFFAELVKYNTILDYIYMAMLLFVGVALIGGIAVRLASIFGILFMVLIYLSIFPLEFNPIIDDHIVYAFLLLMFIFTNAGLKGLTLGKKWQNLSLVKRFSILK